MSEIKNIGGGVLYTAENAQDVKAAVIEAATDDADLRGADLRGANLYGANLYCADLCDADLRGVNLYGANLCGADLRGADLSVANLRDADLGNFKPDLELPKRVAEQILASPEALKMRNWHTCDTTHCVAGWAVHLSGPPGYALETVVGQEVAGMLLMPSASHLFHASDDEAREWAEQVLAENEA